MIRATAIFVCAVLAGTSLAHAYTVKPKGAVHETITRDAEACLAAANGAEPVDCWPRSEAPLLLRKSAFSPLEVASRWPDDPTRQMPGFSLGKFIVNAGGGCKKLVRNDPAVYQVGLLCSSHYGRLQFLHAMRSGPGETPAETRAAMMEWATFLFRVGNATTDFLALGLCSTMAESPVLGGRFAPPRGRQCNEESHEGSASTAWTIRTAFTFKCDNFFRSTKCDVITQADSDTLARNSAIGALIHMVQDSYSQSHAVRGTPDTPFRAKAVCHLPTAFHDYGAQKSHQHRKADKAPIPVDCVPGSEADDVITATARTLWHVRNDKTPEALIAYLESRVFGPAIPAP